MNRDALKARAQIALEAAFADVSPDDKNIYDVFWTEDAQLVRVPWANSCNRDVGVKKDDEGILVNTAPLPNGTPAGAAKYAGCVYRGPIPPEK